jgi:hypothetical protein
MIGYRSKQKICFCLPSNAMTCPMRKDRECSTGILEIEFEELTSEEVRVIEELDELEKSVGNLSRKFKTGSTKFNKNLSDIKRSMDKLKRGK